MKDGLLRKIKQGALCLAFGFATVGPAAAAGIDNSWYLSPANPNGPVGTMLRNTLDDTRAEREAREARHQAWLVAAKKMAAKLEDPKATFEDTMALNAKVDYASDKMVERLWTCRTDMIAKGEKLDFDKMYGCLDSATRTEFYKELLTALGVACGISATAFFGFCGGAYLLERKGGRGGGGR